MPPPITNKITGQSCLSLTISRLWRRKARPTITRTPPDMRQPDLTDSASRASPTAMRTSGHSLQYWCASMTPKLSRVRTRPQAMIARPRISRGEMGPKARSGLHGVGLLARTESKANPGSGGRRFSVNERCLPANDGPGNPLESPGEPEDGMVRPNARAVPDRRRAGPRRDGHRLSGPGHAPRSRRGPQGAAPDRGPRPATRRTGCSRRPARRPLSFTPPCAWSTRSRRRMASPSWPWSSSVARRWPRS